MNPFKIGDLVIFKTQFDDQDDETYSDLIKSQIIYRFLGRTDKAVGVVSAVNKKTGTIGVVFSNKTFNNISPFWFKILETK